MIRHSPSCMTVTHMASWPTTQRMPISEINREQCTMARKTNAARSPTLHKITLIRPVDALPDRQSLPARTIPKPFYP